MRLKIYIFIISTIFLTSGVFAKNAKQPAAVRPILTEEEQRTFDYNFYEGIRLKEEGQFSDAYTFYLQCFSKDSLNAGLLSDMAIIQETLGKSENALLLMEKAVKLNPTNWWFNMHLINMYAGRKKWDNAIIVAEKLVQLFPTKEAAYNLLIPMYNEKKEYAKAIKTYERLEKITGINERISFDKFRLFMMMKKPKKAYPEIDKLILKYPLESRYKILKGDLLMQQKEQDKAYLLYQDVLKNDPESPFVYISLSEYYAQEGENAKAMEYIIMALKNSQLGVDTKIEILSEHIGNLLKRDARIEETESLFKLLIETYPLEEDVYRYYASFLQYIKRDKDAISVFESMLNLNPKNAQTWFSLMQVYFSSQKHAEAISISKRAIQHVDDKAEFSFYQGISYQLLEKTDSALMALKKGLTYFNEKDKKQLKSDFHSNIGDIYIRTNQKDSAFLSFEEAIKVNPENIHALNNYAYYLSIDKTDLQKAERMSAKTIEKEPKNSTYLDTYAWIFYQQGNYSLAKFYIERAIDNLKKDQDPAIIHEHYGDILWMSRKDDKKALEMWQKSYDAGNKTEELKNKINNQGWKRE